MISKRNFLGAPIKAIVNKIDPIDTEPGAINLSDDRSHSLYDFYVALSVRTVVL